MNQPQTDTPKIIQIMLMPNDATHKVLPPAAKGTIMSKEIEKLVPVGQPCLVVPLNLWLQWNGDGDPEDSGDVAESEVTWSREKIFDADVEYVHADEIRRALMGHRRSELWGDNGLIAATMRCVHGYEDLEDQIAAVTKERDELKEQLVYYKANNPKGYAAANRYREQRDTLAEALRQIKSELGVPQPEYPAPIANAVKIADEALAAVEGGSHE